jgi:pilus assembly protein CpaB
MLRGKLPVIISLIMGAAAVVGGYTVIRSEVESKTAGWQLEPVVAAATDIEPQTILTEDLLTVVKVPRKFAFESVVRPNEIEAIKGQEVVGNIKKGEPIHWYQLRGNMEADSLSKAIRKKGRAITISVTERSGVANMVRPADHVDVLGVFRDPNTNRMIAVTLLQNIIVLATGQLRANMIAAGSQTNAGSYSTVTMQVLPEEAEIVVLAQELGNLYLTLRNRTDTDVYEERARTTIDTLITGERVKKLHEKRMRSIQRLKIIRGLGAQPGVPYKMK